MVKRYEQTVLKPGRYFVGRESDGTPRYKNVTVDELQAYVNGTRGLIKAGYAPPVLFEHAEAGSKDGAPLSRRDLAAATVKHGAGWLADVEMTELGEVKHKLDVTDATAIEKLDSGSVRFTSPELRPAWTDGKGTVHQNIFSHVALLHKPRNPDQGPLVPVAMGMEAPLDAVLQFGLDDLVDDDEEKPKKPEAGESTPAAAQEPSAVPEEKAAPDMPKDDSSDNEIKQRVNAIVAHLAELGVILPEDTCEQEMPTILDRVLTGLMTAAETKKASEAENEAKEGGENGGGPPPVVEQGGMVQYGLGDLDSITDKAAGKYLGKMAKELKARMDSLLASRRITPAAHGLLESLQPGVQFGGDLEMLPSVTFEGVLDVLEALPKDVCLDAAAIEQFGVEEHPDGEAYYQEGGEMSPAAVKAEVDKMAEALPGMFKE